MKTTRDWFYSEGKNKYYSGVRIWRARDEGKIVQWDKNGNEVRYGSRNLYEVSRKYTYLVEQENVGLFIFPGSQESSGKTLSQNQPGEV